MTSRRYLNYNVLLLQMSGLYKMDRSRGVIRKACHKFIRLASVCSLLGFLVGLVSEIRNQGELEFTESAMSYAFLGSVTDLLLRVLYYYLCEDETVDLVNMMNSFFKDKTRTLLEERSMERAIFVSNVLTFAWPISATSFILLYAVLQFFSNGANRSLAFPVALPYDWKPSPYYEATYFAHVVVFMVFTYIQGATDVFFFASVLLTAEQYKLLGWEFKNVLYTSLMENGVPKERVLEFRRQFNGNRNISEGCDFVDRDILETCGTDKFKAVVFKNINGLIAHHQSLVAFGASLDEFFTWLMFVFYFVIGFTSLFMNYIMITSGDVSLLMMFAPITALVLIDLFLPCMLSNILSSEAEKLRFQVYEMPWYLCGKESKTNLKLLFQKLNSPVTLTMGKLFPLDLPLFLLIVKTLNSYCIVLYQLTET